MELGIFTCSECGALVAAHDWTLHAEWHARQGATASPLERQLIVHAGKRSFDLAKAPVKIPAAKPPSKPESPRPKPEPESPDWEELS